ncbi:carbohydrate porin [Methylomonas sp. MgM2]
MNITKMEKKFHIGFVSALMLLTANGANALGPVEVPPTWGGDWESRPRASGDWGGVRDELGKKGVVLDADMFLLPGGVVTGGNKTGAEFWGNVDYSLNLDTDKMGLWPGGFFKFQGVSTFGNSLYDDAAAVVPTNVAYLYPEFDEPASALMGASLTQFLSPKFGLMMGKMNLFDFTPTEFYGNYRTQFMNSGLNFSMAYLAVPMSAYGGGVLLLPTEDIMVAALALDANGTPTDNDISKAFDDGTTVLTAAKINIKPFGLLGHQAISGVWSDKVRFALDQDPSNIANGLLKERYPRLGNPGPILERILAKFFPDLLEPVQPAKKKNSTWAVIYSFDQYLWQPEGGDSNQGFGMFFSFGATDGNPNPVQYSYIMGVSGKGLISSRPNDSFGVGWARTQFSSQFLTFMREKLDIGMQVEDAVELYYTAQLTPWLNISPDLQIVNSALNKTLNDTGGLKNIDTSVEASLRMNILF